MSRTGLSFRAERRLSDLADQAREDAQERASPGAERVAGSEAFRAVLNDDALRDVVEAEYRLDSRSFYQDRDIRSDGGDPSTDPVVRQLREAHRATVEAVESRVSQLVERAVSDGESAQETETVDGGQA